MGLCVVESIVEPSSLRNALPLSLGSSKLQLLMRVCTGNEKTSEHHLGSSDGEMYAKFGDAG